VVVVEVKASHSGVHNIIEKSVRRHQHLDQHLEILLLAILRWSLGQI